MELKMKMILTGCCATILVLSLQIPGALGSALAAGAGEITQDGPYTIHEQKDWTRASTMNETQVSVSQEISFADLDFSKQADLDRLRDRLKSAAIDNCAQLARRFPSATFSSDQSRRECIRDANRAGYAEAMNKLQMKAMAGRNATARARTGLSVIQ